jgi:hypothetical protein
MASELRAYPIDLAARVRDVWPAHGEPLPKALERVLDTAYHASFLRDEERPVTFRILVAPPSAIAGDAGPPEALLPLVFEVPREFEEHELRRLSPAAKFHRALVGVDERDGELVTWGLVQSGPRWLQANKGGRAREPAVPPRLVVRAVHPGHLVVCCGSTLVAELRNGKLSDFGIDVFQAQWLSELFAKDRVGLVEEHRSSGGTSEEAVVSQRARQFAQQMIKRVISTMRAAHHGGTIINLPTGCTAENFLNTKYPISDTPARRHFRRVVLAMLASPDADTAAHLDESLFELAHLIAALADVDGAVVLTKRFEMLGFGAEIAGNLPVVHEVRRALDQEGTRYAIERTDGVGTRHRSAYRLCAAIDGAVAIVVSHDGDVRFVTKREGAVMYWDHGVGDD